MPTLPTFVANKAREPLVTHEDRVIMQAVENLRTFNPGGNDLFEDLCADTYGTIVLLRTRQAQTAIELAVKREVARLNFERLRRTTSMAAAALPA